MTPVHVFWTEPTGKIRRSFRCYETHPDQAQDPKSRHYCDASRPKDEVDDSEESRADEDVEHWPWESFPTQCEGCGRAFVKPHRQIYRDELYVIKTGPRAGEIISDRKRPVGAMRDLTWLKDSAGGAYTGPDGIALGIQLPDGEFYVDSQCSNCTRDQYVPVEGGEPGARKFVRTHYCWQREGDPRTGYVNVGKIKPESTCAAGAGSIWQNMPKGFHGFVYRGFVCEGADFQAINQFLDAGRPLAPAEAVLTPAQRDQPVSVAPIRDDVGLPSRIVPVARPVTPAPTGQHGWRSNRGFQMRKKR